MGASVNAADRREFDAAWEAWVGWQYSGMPVGTAERATKHEAWLLWERARAVPRMDKNMRTAVLALKAIVAHQRTLKGTVAFDPFVWHAAYTALNVVGYLDREVPAAEAT